MLGVGRDGPVPVAAVSAVIPETKEGWAATQGSRTRAIAVSEQEAIAVLLSVDRLGPVTLAGLIGAFGSAVGVLEAALRSGGARRVRDGWRAAGGDPRSFDDAVASAVVSAAVGMDAIVEPIRAAGLTLLTVDEPAYPARLRAIEIPPPLLFVRGSVDALSAPRAFAVVGTRRPTDAGRMVATGIATAIVRTGGAIVSGLAAGIDGSAHAAAVREGGATVAVLGGGHGRLFPRLHARLADEIVDRGGAVVSEQPPLVGPERWMFPRRNRIIAGLSEATIVVEAGLRSGALITAAWALEQGRACFLVPGPLGAPASEGCLAFLRECHGEARLVSGIPALLEDLDLVEGRRASAERLRAGHAHRRVRRGSAAASEVLASPEAVLADLGPATGAVGRLVAAARGTVDEIVVGTDLPVATVLAALTILEDRGLVVSAYGRYRAAGPLAAAIPGSTSARRSSRPAPAIDGT